MIIDRLVPAKYLSHGPLDSFWYGTPGRRTLAGVEVNEQIAMTYSACWAATRLLAGTAACLPFSLYQRLPDGSQRTCEDDPLHAIVHDTPNPEMSSTLWRAAKFAQQVNYGNCFSEIERNGLGQVCHLWPIHASRVRLMTNDADCLYYEVRNNDGAVTPLPYSDMLHPPSMMTDDGRWGKGVIRNARETIGHALATEKYGAGWFGSGGKPTAVLKHPTQMDAEARANLRREWNEIYGGPDNPNKVAVLWEGVTYESIATSPEDSQFIASRQHNIEEVARWYGVPPHLIGHLLRSTNNNIEAQGIEYVKYSLMPWLKIWEQECGRKLLTKHQREAGYYFEFNVDALERGDLASRTAALVQQFFNGALTLNQWAKIENRPPIGPLGDLHFVQQAMTTLENAAKGPQPGAPIPPVVVPQPYQAPPAPPAAAPTVSPEPASDPNQAVLHSATLDVLEGIVSVMLDREAKDAQEAAKTPAKFLAWLDAFYDEHENRMRKALARPIRACVLASRKPLIVDETIGTAVKAHIAAGRAALLEAAGATPDEFPRAVQKCVSNWKRTEIIDLLKG